MRQADAKGGSMKKFLSIYLLAPLALLALDGTVINRTTGKPANNATVTLYKLGQAGPEALETVHTDAQGHFEIQQNPQGGPHNLQATYAGVTYAHVLPPGSPSAGVTLEVYDSSKEPGAAKVGQHFLILQPGPGQMVIDEVYMYKNEGKTAYNDPGNGTLKFYLPPAAKGVVKVQAKGPGGMPLTQLAQKTGKPDIYKIDFAIKPGETQFELSYMVPYTSPGRFGSKDVAGAPETLLVAPQGVEIKGDGVEFTRQEPRSQAAIYTVKKARYEFEISGEMKASETQQAEDNSSGSSGPSLEQEMPRLFSQINGSAGLLEKVWAVKWILLLAAGILALGFILLYRQQEPAEAATQGQPEARDSQGAVQPAKERHERRRR
jgi:hypothetical protein